MTLIEWLHQNFTPDDFAEIMHRLETSDGCLMLTAEALGETAQRDNPEKWSRVARLADARLTEMYEERLASDKDFAAHAILTMEHALQSGQGAIEDAVPLIAQASRVNGGAPTPVQRQRHMLPPEERAQFDERLERTAQARGMTKEQHIAALNQAAANGLSTELNPTGLIEAQAAEALKAMGKERFTGMTASASLGAILRNQAEGKGVGSRQMPFDPRLSREEQTAEFVKTMPPQTLAEARRLGVDPRRFMEQTLAQVRTATVHDELQGRLARRDVKLPPLPKEVPNDSTDRRRDILAAMNKHGTTPEALMPQRRHTIGNDTELAVRAAYAEHEGQSPNEFLRQNKVPEEIRDEYAGLDLGEAIRGAEEENDDDNRRADIERAFEQHGG